ncbi:hypothetical protein Unana1_04868 [Umbelopsis nana]
MARVHLFTSQHSVPGDNKQHQTDKAYAALSALEQATIAHTHKEASDEPHTLDVTAVASPNITDDNIDDKSIPNDDDKLSQIPALAAALLQDPNNMDVIGSLAAALSAKQAIKNGEKSSDKASTSKPGEASTSGGQGKGDSSEIMDQATAARALQLLGLSQSDSQKGKATATDDTDTSSDGSSSPMQVDDNNSENLSVTDNILLATYPGLSSSEAMELSKSTTAESLSDDGKRGAWTKEEDEKLLQGIKRLGYGKWKEIAATIPGRKGKQLKQRWDNSLAAKYVGQELLQPKSSNIEPSSQEPASSQSASQEEQTQPQTVTEPKTLKMLDSDWSEFAQKLTERLRSSQQEGAEQSLSLLNDVASQLARSSQNLPFPDAAALAVYAQHLQAGGQENGENHSSIAGQLYLPNPFGGSAPSESAISAAAAAVAAVASASSSNNVENAQDESAAKNLKRKREEQSMAPTQADAVDYYASAQPITTTINNETHTVFPCLYPGCTKSFMRLYNLKSHSRTHTDDRPYQCDVCTQAFSRNHDLKRHAKIHGGNKPYHCPICTKTFSRLDALKRHRANQRNRCM